MPMIVTLPEGYPLRFASEMKTAIPLMPALGAMALTKSEAEESRVVR